MCKNVLFLVVYNIIITFDMCANEKQTTKLKCGLKSQLFNLIQDIIIITIIIVYSSWFFYNGYFL